MTDSDDAAQTWRPLVITRISFVLLAIWFSGFGLFAIVYAFDSGDFAELLLPASFLAIIVPCLLVTRARITLRDECLEYRNLGGVRRICWDEIRGASAGYSGIILVLASHDTNYRSTAVAVAVQKWNISRWLNLSGRADRLIALIEQRGGAGEYRYTPPHT